MLRKGFVIKRENVVKRRLQGHGKPKFCRSGYTISAHIFLRMFFGGNYFEFLGIQQQNIR